MRSELVTQEFKPFKSVAGSIVMIECTLASKQIRRGTGLIYELCQREGGTVFQAIVTNRHLAQDAKWTRIRFTSRKPNGEPDHENQVEITCTDFWQACIPHPDPKVDLCIYPLQRVLNKAEQEGTSIYVPSTELYRMPSAHELAYIDAVEEVYMVGYPTSLQDSATGTPIYRKGITATDINLRYADRPQFLIDTGLFQCSSGSPVFMVVNKVSRVDDQYILEKQIRLVGIIGFVLIQSDQEVIRTLACNDLPIRQSNQTINHLGAVIHYSKLLDFEKMLA